MTRVDFYILPDIDDDARMRFACRLAYKALTGGNRIHVHTRDDQHQNSLNQLMWEYPDHQFLPHASIGETNAHQPVVIGCGDPLDDFDQVLINLNDSVPTFFGRFERVAEIIVDSVKAQGRSKYKYYRDRGYPLFHHQLENWDD